MLDKFQININDRVYRLSELAVEIEQKAQATWLLDLFRFILRWFDSSDSITQKTSGSTGVPKTMQLKKSSMNASAERTISFFELKENDRVWLCLPIEYIAAKMQVVRCLIGNLKLHVSEPTSTPIVPEIPIQFAALVPMQLKRMLVQNQSFASIETLILGGAAADNALVQSLQGLTTKVYATYGMTETCSHIALQKLNGVDQQDSFFVLDGIKVSINSSNCLEIKAPDLHDEPIVSNDLVELIDQNHFRVIGRTDNVINSGGLKINPEEIEAAVAGKFNLEVVLLGIPDRLLGQKLVLVSEKEIMPEVWEQVKEFVEQHFGKNKTPKLKKVLNHFPRTKSMKVVRAEIETIIVNDQV